MSQPARKQDPAALHAARLARDPDYRRKVSEANKVMEQERGAPDDPDLLHKRLKALRS
jgi:hypothetical protein